MPRIKRAPEEPKERRVRGRGLLEAAKTAIHEGTPVSEAIRLAASETAGFVERALGVQPEPTEGSKVPGSKVPDSETVDGPGISGSEVVEGPGIPGSEVITRRVDSEGAAGMDPRVFEAWQRMLFGSNFYAHDYAEHQIASFNKFLNEVLSLIITGDYRKLVVLGPRLGELHTVILENVVYQRPVHRELDGPEVKVRRVYPNECRLRSLTYGGYVFVDVIHKIQRVNVNEDPRFFEGAPISPNIDYSDLPEISNTITTVPLFLLPMMLGSDGCWLANEPPNPDEDPFDRFGYFIINGYPRVIMPQEMLRHNYPILTRESKLPDRFKYSLELRSRYENKHRSTSTLYLKITRSDGGKTPKLLVKIPFTEKMLMPVSVVFRLLGIVSQEEAELCVFPRAVIEAVERGEDHPEKAAVYMLRAMLSEELAPEFPDRNAWELTIGEVYVWFGANSGKNKNTDRTNRDINHVKASEFLPHLGLQNDPSTRMKKAFYFGRMIVRRMLQATVGVSQLDDRDHMSVKQVHCVGTLLVYIVRQLMREIMKSTRASLLRALQQPNKPTPRVADVIPFTKLAKQIRYIFASGNWTAKKNRSNHMVGVSQTLQEQNRLCAATHLGRFNNPVPREGKQVDPRHLHYSHYGRKCPKETPEGEACGLLMNLSMLAHLRTMIDSRFFRTILYRDYKVMPLSIYVDLCSREADLAQIVRDEAFVARTVAENARDAEDFSDDEEKRPTDATHLVEDPRAPLGDPLHGLLDRTVKAAIKSSSKEAEVGPLFQPTAQDRLFFPSAPTMERGTSLFDPSTVPPPAPETMYPDTLKQAQFQIARSAEQDSTPLHGFEYLSGDNVVLLNNDVVGVCTTMTADQMVEKLREDRRNGLLPWSMSVSRKPHGVSISSDEGCVLRPLLLLQRFNLVRGIVEELADECECRYPVNLGPQGAEWEHEEDEDMVARLSHNEDFMSKLWPRLVSRGVIEYLDNDEESQFRVAMSLGDVQQEAEKMKEGLPHIKYTHMEVHPIAMLGICAAQIPFSNYNQSPRNMYQASMVKQAVGLSWYTLSKRMQGHAHVAWYLQTPIVQTWAEEFVPQLRESPLGCNITLAVMSWDGHSQEDSCLINERAIQMGLFRSFYYVGFQEAERGDGSEQVRIRHPMTQQTTVRNHKQGDYSKLDEDGLVSPGLEVVKGTVIIGMTRSMLTPDGRRDLTAEEDISILYDNEERAVVDQVMVSTNRDGKRMVRVILRQTRIPQVGDKFCSRHGQKSTIGRIVAYEDMPFAVRTILVKGRVTRQVVCPDLVINPHAIPSRMTAGHILEMVSGKAAALFGAKADGTPFRGVTSEMIQEQLVELGMERYGCETMVSGQTGEVICENAYTGTIYYQKLRHMVLDKYHGRTAGGVYLLTRQPLEGRAKKGGLRFGEMERDAVVAHGASNVTGDRLLGASDLYMTPICPNCGNIGENVHDQKHGATVRGRKAWCRACDVECAFVSMPFAWKTVTQECAAMNIKLQLNIRTQKLGDIIPTLK